MNLTQRLLERRQQDKDMTAVLDSLGTEMTYGALTTTVLRMIATLKQLDVSPGDFVHLMMLDRAATVAWFLAVVGTGAVAVMTNPRSKKPNLDNMLDRLPCKLVITEHNLKDHVSATIPAMVITHDHELAPPQDPDWFDQEHAPAMILWSSGTTGMPKAIVHGHHNLWHCAMINGPVFHYRHGGKAYVTAKMIHAVGICNLLYAMYQGAAIYLDHDLVIPSRVKRNLLTFRPDVMISISGVYAAMINQLDIPHMPDTQFISGGDRVYQKLVDFWNTKSGNKLCIMYGMSEFLTQAFFNDQGTTDDLGKVIPGWEVRLVDEHDRDVDDGTVGRILVRSACQGQGYWPYTTFKDRMIDDWYDTGDLAVRTKGRYHYQGRSNNDVVKNMGNFINLSNIETAILQNPMVEQAAVSLYANPYGSNELGAIIVPANPDQDRPQLLKSLRADLVRSLSRLECPKTVKIVDQIPRTDNGKVSRVLVSEILNCTTTPGD